MVRRLVLAVTSIAALLLCVGAGPAGAAASPGSKLSFVGTYTTTEQIGTFHSTGSLTVLANGVCNDASPLDLCSWSQQGRLITVVIGNDAGEVIHWLGKHTMYGIANPRHPGAAQLYSNGWLVATGTFYAKRTHS